MLAKASNKIKFAEAEAAVKSIVSVTVSTFATAEAEACGRGVFEANTVVIVIAEALGTAYAEVVAIALAMVAPGVSVAEIDVQAIGDILKASTVTGFSATEVLGDGKSSFAVQLFSKMRRAAQRERKRVRLAGQRSAPRTGQ